MTDDEIRTRVRERFANGTLPRHIHAVMKPLGAGITPDDAAITAGSALNDPCSVCDARATQLRYNTTPGGPFAFHQRCYEIWKEEAGRPIRRT